LGIKVIGNFFNPLLGGRLLLWLCWSFIWRL